MRKVSSFTRFELGSYRIAYFLVANDYYENEVRAELDKQAEAFAQDMRGEGVFVQPFPSHRQQTADEVLAKPWPPSVKQELEAAPEPLILVLESDFDSFDPREQRWAIIRLTDFDDDAHDVQPMLKKLSLMTRNGDDVIAYLVEAAEREELRAERTRIARFAARAGSYVEWTPKIPIIGIGLDVKAILRDIATVS